MNEFPRTSGLSESVSDEELTRLALAADPDAPLDDDARPWNYNLGDFGQLLPDWYMPSPITRGRRRGTTLLVVGVVTTLVLICASGLCVTSGFVSIA